MIDMPRGETDFASLAPHQRIVLEMPAGAGSGALTPTLFRLIREYELHGVLFSQHSHVGLSWPGLKARAHAHGVSRTYIDDSQFQQDPGYATATAKEIISTSHPDYLTINAASGRRALSAVNAIKDGTLLLASTLSSDLSEDECEELYGAPPEERVLHLGNIAMECKLDGIVASGREMRALCDNPTTRKAIKVAIGNSLPEHTWHSQMRGTTPRDALDNGADLLVVGRAVSRAPDPEQALNDIIANIT